MTSGGNKFAIMRIGKIVGRKHVRDALKHNLRQLKNDPANIETDRTHLNRTHAQLDTYDKCKSKFERNLSDIKVRKNAVMLHELVITMSPDEAKRMSDEDIKQYFNDAVKWGCEMHGGAENLISWSVHYDETTPHLHALYTPVFKEKNSKTNKVEKKLASRRILGSLEERRKPTPEELKKNREEIENAEKHGLRKIPAALVPDRNNVFVIRRSADRLSDYQTDFYNKVARKYGLDRGIKKSITNASHTPIKAQNKALEEQNRELEEQNREIAALNDELIAAQDKHMESAKKKLERMSEIDSKLKTLSHRYESMESNYSALEKDIERLENTRRNLASMTIEELEEQISRIENDFSRGPSI